MATETPPPYFPQNPLAGHDENRYRKFKIIVAVASVILLLFIGAAITGVVYLVKWLF